jgi:hypothetical protein
MIEKSWFEAFDYLRQYVEQKGHAKVPKNYVTEDGFKLSIWVRAQQCAYRRGELSVKAKKALEQLPGWAWEFGWQKAEKQWLEVLEELRKYAEREGHTYITEEGYYLGAWANKQRRLYKHGKLTKDKQKALEGVKNWTWDISWMQAFKRLRKYAKRKCDTLVPVKYVTEDGYHLGVWVRYQRNLYRQCRLSVKKQKVLEGIIGWVWSANEAKWIEGFNYLRDYVQRKGNALVPLKYVTEDGYHLGVWVRNQRNLYRQCRLSMEQQKVLEGIIGWVWSANEAKCIEGFNYLRDYVQRKGNALVPQRYIQKNGYKLGRWVSTQRQLYRQRKLTKKRQEELEKLPGWVWNAKKKPRELL